MLEHQNAIHQRASCNSLPPRDIARIPQPLRAKAVTILKHAAMRKHTNQDLPVWEQSHYMPGHPITQKSRVDVPTPSFEVPLLLPDFSDSVFRLCICAKLDRGAVDNAQQRSITRQRLTWFGTRSGSWCEAASPPHHPKRKLHHHSA